MQGLRFLTVTYEASDRPRTIFFGLVACALLAPVLYVMVQPNHASAFSNDLDVCAKRAGLDRPEWLPMHGFDEFNIGREFLAKSPLEQEALACALETSSAEFETRPGDFGERHPAVRIWHKDTPLEQDLVIYYTPSD